MLESAFQPMIGQPQAVELLVSAVQRDRIAPGYLFVGPSGVGRQLAASCFASVLLATHTTTHERLLSRVRDRNHPDLLWIEPTYLHQGKRLSAREAAEAGVKRKAPPQIRLEQIREIAQFLSRPPLQASRSVVVIEDAETMAEAAANGLLKTLEEPGQATLILIAPSLESILPTLVSRCQRIPFQRLSQTDMAAVLQRENYLDVLAHADVLALAQGSPGGAIAHWQQLQAIAPDFLDALNQPPRSLRQALALAGQIHKTLDTEAQLWLVDYLQHRYWQLHRQPSLLRPLEIVRRQLRAYVQPRLAWEVAFMEIVGSNL
ncbi:DNA polymerase III subunit delta' [Leptolyngbya sp. AN02str]|uniref:DNA polymerase III subunit delta' n=1 Tax=Leptolyngbya sp. AN02str TaxID=3423363 RepID=UPI003D317A6A